MIHIMRVAATKTPKAMSVGAVGTRVQDLEQKLKASGALKGKVDDTFDQRTAAAVVAWKKDHGFKNHRPTVGKRMSAALGLQGSFKMNESGTETPKKLKGGTYNCLVGRNPAVVGKTVKHFLKSRDLDFLQVQEITQYHKALSNIPGYKLITFPGAKDHGESGLLVKDSIKTQSPQLVQADTGWKAPNGDTRQARGAVSAKLAGWLRVSSVHLPPAIDWKNGHAVGGAARVESYKQLMEKLAAQAKRQHAKNPGMGILIGGDWNEGARSTGYGSPSWLANKAGLKKFTPGPGIDWAMGLGVKVTGMKKGPNGGSDHRLVTYTVTRP